MGKSVLPSARAAAVDSQGAMTPQFFRFFQALSDAQAGNASAADIAAINAQLAELQAEIDALPQSSGYPKLQATYPILSQGLLQNGFAKLALDQPGDTGTGSLLAFVKDAWGRITGTKAATITGTAGRVTVANGDASAGLPTIDLATVPDTGGGSLLRFVRDAWGRITGTSTPSTADLAEGSNLYFTASRVLATVLAGLSTATNAAITAADSVLSALGKLQAQVSATLAKSANLSDVANTATAHSNLRTGFTHLEVNLTVSQTGMPEATFNAIKFNNVVADSQSEYSAATGIFTAAKSGVYSIASFMHTPATANVCTVASSIFVNGVETKRLSQITVAASLACGVGGSTILTLNAGDAVSFRFYVSSAGGSVTADGTAALNYGAISRIS